MHKGRYTSYCKLCNRVRPLTFHHLIPVILHKNKWFKKNFDKMEMTTQGIMICRDCHMYIHDTFKPKEIGREFNTEDKLRANEKVSKFINFVRKKR